MVFDPTHPITNGEPVSAPIRENFLQLAVHHYGDTEPPAKVAGFIWWDTTTPANEKLKCYTGSAWANLFDHMESIPVPSAGSGGVVETLNFVIDGGGAVIETGIKGDSPVEFAGTIVQATLLADQSGDIVVDILKATYAGAPPTVSITAAAKPELSAAEKSQDPTLSGWTTAIAAGDVLRFVVDSVATVQRVTVSLKIVRS